MNLIKRYKKFILITLIIIFLIVLVYWKTQRMIQQLEMDSPAGMNVWEVMNGMIRMALTN